MAYGKSQKMKKKESEKKKKWKLPRKNMMKNTQKGGCITMTEMTITGQNN